MNATYSLIAKSLITFGIVIALIVGAAIPHPYSYYIVMRWLIMTAFIYLLFTSFKNKRTGLLIFYSLSALAFNPFTKNWLQKETWYSIDYLVAVIITIIIVYEWLEYEKTGGLKRNS